MEWQCRRISVGSRCCREQWLGCWRKRLRSAADGQREDRSRSGGGAPWKQPESDWWRFQEWNDQRRWSHQCQRQTWARLSDRKEQWCLISVKSTVKFTKCIQSKWKSKSIVAQVTIKPQSWGKTLMVLAKSQPSHYSTLPTPKHRQQCQVLIMCLVKQLFGFLILRI